MSFAQTIDFSLATPQPNLVDLYAGSFASGDIDGDGDKDLLMAGITPSKETALYLNDGNGSFTEVTNIPFPEASGGVTIFKDLDADNDLDLFFSGNGSSLGPFAYTYLNDGSGVFTQLANSALPQFANSGAIIDDIDNDGDPDIFISTLDVNNNLIADVYLNDGNANFTAMGSTVFVPTQFGAIEFIDVENDGDLDIINSGTEQNGNSSTILYLNDSLGNYTIDSNSVFQQITATDIDAADTDNDGDLDILMSGTNDSNDVLTLLYINDGNGLFTELSPNNLQQTFSGTNEIADFDNDGDQDIVIIGSQAGGLPNIFNIVYANLGNNQFTPVDTIGGEYISASIVDDFNGDGLLDIIIQGFADKTNVYWNSSLPLSIEGGGPESLLASVYPNPSNGSLYIQANSGQDLSLKIYSIDGTLVHKQDAVQGLEKLQLNLPNGLYIAEIASGDVIEKHKVIVLR